MTGTCQVLTLGRAGCGCITCQAELKYGTPIPLSAYPLKQPLPDVPAPGGAAQEGTT